MSDVVVGSLWTAATSVVVVVFQWWRLRQNTLETSILNRLKMVEERKKLASPRKAALEAERLLIETIDADIRKLTKGVAPGSETIGLCGMILSTVAILIFAIPSPGAVFYPIGWALLIIGQVLLFIGFIIAVLEFCRWRQRRGKHRTNVAQNSGS